MLRSQRKPFLNFYIYIYIYIQIFIYFPIHHFGFKLLTDCLIGSAQQNIFHTQGQLLEGRVTGDIQPNDSKNLTEGDSYEFSRFYVIHNSRQRKLTQLPYYIQIGQRTTVLNVTLDGPMFPVHSLSPQKYTNLLRLASTPTYLPGKYVIPILINKICIFILKSMCRCRGTDSHNTKNKT